MRSSIARATAIEYALIAGGTLVSCIMRYLHNGLEIAATEYGLFAAGLSVTIIAVVQELGSKLHRSL